MTYGSGSVTFAVEKCVNVRLKAMFMEGIMAFALLSDAVLSVLLKWKARTDSFILNMAATLVQSTRCVSLRFTGSGKCNNVEFIDVMVQAKFSLEVSQSTDTTMPSERKTASAPLTRATEPLLKEISESIEAKIATTARFLYTQFNLNTNKHEVQQV
jgi:hypothetical protein